MTEQLSAPLCEGVLGASAAAAGGAPYVTEPVDYTAILLVGFGGPEGQEDVIPYLRNVTRGRGIPDERLEEVAHHYRHFGGVSPINEHNRQLKAALEAELASRGIDLPVYWGNRNWEPYITPVVKQAYDDGHRTVIAIATSAYSSYSSDRQYREDLAQALIENDLLGKLAIDKVRQFFDHPGFVKPFAESLSEALADFASEGFASDEIEVLFATHSIPTGDASKSGPAERGFGEGGAYAAQHQAVAEVIMRDHPGIPWQLVYQSRSGPPSQPWLEPDINDAIAELPAAGRKAIAIVPLGFVSDHMEVMWDLDNEAMESAEEHGLVARRTATPGCHPAFVSGLIDLVLERRDGVPVEERPALTDIGPWYDICRPGCCVSGRFEPKPAIAGETP